MIPEVFTALLPLIPELVKWLQEVSRGDPKAYLLELGEAFTKLNHAKTTEERQKAAHNINALISRLPN